MISDFYFNISLQIHTVLRTKKLKKSSRLLFLFICFWQMSLNLIALNPIITGDSIVCLGNTLALEVQFIPGASYQWQNEQGENISSVHTLTVPGANFSTAGQYTVTIIHESCPEPNASIQVSIVEPPSTPEISNNGPVCEGQTVLLDGPSMENTTYRWLDPFGAVLATTEDAAIINIQENQAGIYTLEVTQYGCTSPQSFTEVGVISVEAAPILMTDTTVCFADTILITTSNFPDAEYFWEGPNGFASSEAGEIQILNATTENSGIYSLSIAVNGCETPVGEININVFEEVSGTWIEDISVCEGLTAEAGVTLTGSAPFEVFFSEGENGSIAGLVSEMEGSLTLFPMETTEYQLNRVIDSNNCIWEGEEILQVTVNENPEFVDLDDSFCNELNSEYVVHFFIENGLPPYTVQGQSGTVNGDEYFSEYIPSGFQYFVQITDANGCVAGPESGSHSCACETTAGTIDQTPLRFCTNESAVITQEYPPVLDDDDVFYYILHDALLISQGNILAEFNSLFFEFLPGMNAGQSYYVTAVAGTDDGTGKVNFDDLCVDESGTVEVIFYEQPPSPIIFGEDILCPNEFLELTTEPFDGEGIISYLWTTPNSNFTTVSPSLYIEEVNLSNAGDYSVRVDYNGCTSNPSSPFEIFVEVPDENAIAAADETLCGENTGQLMANLPEDATGRWTTNNSSTILSETSSISQVDNLQDGENIFYWTLSTAECLDYSVDSLSLNVIPANTAEDDEFTLAEDQFFVEINPLDNDEKEEDEQLFLQIINAPNLGRLVELDDNWLEFKRPLCFEGELNFSYASCIETEECPMLCDTADVIINVITDPTNSYLFIPDGITANGDGLNDYLVIEGIEKYENNELVIVNQAGQIVHSERPYTNSWNGEYQGKKLPEGTYYYILKTDVTTKEIVKGRVYLFR